MGTGEGNEKSGERGIYMSILARVCNEMSQSRYIDVLLTPSSSHTASDFVLECHNSKSKSISISL